MGNRIVALTKELNEWKRLKTAVLENNGPVAVFGTSETHRVQIAAATGEDFPVLFVCATDTGAMEYYEALQQIDPNVTVFLPRETPLVHVMTVSEERSGQRVRAMSELLFSGHPVTVCSVAALMQAIAPKRVFLSQCIRISSGDDISPRDLMAQLVNAGYERVDLVEGRGQVAARGDLLDVYPPQNRMPVRIEFWGDSIDQMRDFDPVTQKSVSQRTELVIPPAFETPQTKEAIQRALYLTEGKEGFDTQRDFWEMGSACAGADSLLPFLYEKLDTLLDYLPENTVIFAEEPSRLDEAARTSQMVFEDTVKITLERGEGDALQGTLQISAGEVMEKLSGPHTAVFYTLTRSHPLFEPREILQIHTAPTSQYMGDMGELVRDLKRWKREGQAVLLLAGDQAQALFDQLKGDFDGLVLVQRLEREPVHGEVLVTGDSLVNGFCYPENDITVLGITELFGKRVTPRQSFRKKSTLSFSDLKKGDYVVHESHGIGRFTGTEALTVEGNTRDYLLIEYAGGDRLYIPTDQLNRIQKYISGEDESVIPHLSKLGGNEWHNRVNRAKESAKKLAVDLAALYANRAKIKGHAFAPDSQWQKQLEERFPYRETPDQLQCIQEIKKDMERARPMDRLLCGDVGYGKTEVALRAAFKAVQDSKQVAVLVPTTILAQQHYNTFAARFSDFPVRIACLSRFQSVKQRDDIKKRLAEGKIDVVIGTHALLAKDVRFKDLGLLVIDEEHRFGVNHKEKLKDLRQTVDVLTLTATPIPRTLNLSMTGIRDISVIETPPEGRYPVQTFVMEYSDGLLIDAITKEVARGGQAYVVSNNVMGMEGLAGRIRELIPDVSVMIAHGQMPEDRLEQTMIDFLDRKADVLVCSTIIESGLDLPNANTMIVMDADRFGLAQLYQLRGRIGRSTRLGYAYLTIPRGKQVNEKAQKRLMAIREFAQFGAGFQLAMRDLEIRGAGSLLGAEQHGHITDVGYEYYLKIVRNAVREANGETELPEAEVTLEIPINAHIPHDYIGNEVQRLSVYRKIADVDSGESSVLLKEELEDRYGEIPRPVENLFTLALIKSYAGRAGLAQVTVSDNCARMQFLPDAPLDGGQLISAVSEIPGARLIASEAPAVEIRQKNRTAAEIAEFLPQIIYRFVHCIGTF